MNATGRVLRDGRVDSIPAMLLAGARDRFASPNIGLVVC
jgi:hypothetical protein